MTQYTSLDRKNNKRKLINNKLILNFQKIIHPLLLCMSKIKIKYKLQKCSEYDRKIIKKQFGRPVIYAVNHTNSYDIPIALNVIRNHTIVLLGKQPLEQADEIFFKLNGVLFVDRKDKNDTSLSKEAMKQLLINNKDLLIFPEGTWNTTDANLMLEMKWGIIEIAQETNALIVPLALDYDYDNNICNYKFGNSLDVSNLSKKEGIDLLRDSLATLRWHLFEIKKVGIRSQINVEEEKKRVEKNVHEYPKLDYEYEKSVIYKTADTYDDVFSTIYKLK